MKKGHECYLPLLTETTITTIIICPRKHTICYFSLILKLYFLHSAF